MKLLVLSLTALLFLASSGLSAQAVEGKKPLVLFFSYSGNSQAIAKLIAQKTGGDLVEIEPVKAYPKDYNDCVDQAKEELNRSDRPEVKTDPARLAGHDAIILVHPNWWGTLPMPVATFLEKADFSGKTVFLVTTHGGGGTGRSQKDLSKLAKEATVKDTLAIYGKGDNTLASDLDKWLAKNGLTS
ncbi:MAG: NAD(P)H-dependent oxidoreductase [Deltaproteobacteria bacterium]|jgi:flavodoxin|nr:NAD(P)H-dependent oxidoreductase [Deltaproteobacteria bacterium]